jgi:hypothetical protein
MGENRDVIDTGRVYLRALEAAQAGNAIVAGLNLNEADVASFNRRLNAAATRLRSYGVAGIISADTVEYDAVAKDFAAEFALTPEQLAQVINCRNGLATARSGFEEALKDHDSIQNEAHVAGVIDAMGRVSAGYRFNSENQIDQGVRAALNHLKVSGQPFGDRTFTLAHQGTFGNNDDYKMPRLIATPPVQAPRTPTPTIEGSVPKLVLGAIAIYNYSRENPTGNPGDGVWTEAFTEAEAQLLGLTEAEATAFIGHLKTRATAEGAPATLTQEDLVAALNASKDGFGTQHQAAIVTAMAAPPAGPAVEPARSRGVIQGDFSHVTDATTRTFLENLHKLVNRGGGDDLEAIRALTGDASINGEGFITTQKSAEIIERANALITQAYQSGNTIDAAEWEAIRRGLRETYGTTELTRTNEGAGLGDGARTQLTALSRAVTPSSPTP